MGKNCIRELLRAYPDQIIKVYTVSGNTSDNLYKELKKKGVAIEHVTKQELYQLVDSTSHQSYVADTKQRGSLEAGELLRSLDAKGNGIVLMLDSIFDPHNFGAILRASECFRVDGVVFSKNRGTDVTPVVSKVSSGASELVPLVKVSNLAETARYFHDAGFTILCADIGEHSVSVLDYHFPDKTLLILGSEGEGIQNLLRKRSDFSVMIPMLGKIDSLNVSQAAAVFLYAYRSQHPV